MSACGHDHDQGPPDARGVAAALAGAEARCASEGERLTAPRRRVLELLLQAGEPMKAYDLIARFGGDDGQAAKPPTVYRALDFLERQGFAHRIASISAYVACTAEGEDPAGHAAAFLICDCCGATREVSAPLGEAFSHAAAHAGYRLSRTTIEGHGRCPDCAEAA